MARYLVVFAARENRNLVLEQVQQKCAAVLRPELRENEEL
jgi:hypothetical protein